MNVLGKTTSKHYEEYVPKDHHANAGYRIDMLSMAGTDSRAAAQMKVLCAEDPLFYINTFCTTYSPKDSMIGYPITPFVTYEFQDEAILNLVECIGIGQDVAMPKSREMGASWIGLTVLEWCWHFKDWLSFLMVSRKEDLVDKKGVPGSLFWKIDFLHRYQPRWLLPTNRWLQGKDPNRRALHLANADNDSVIDGESTTENVGVGDRRTALFIDEFGAFETDAGYSVLRGTRDVTNCRIFNSTPRGQNAFYDVVEKTAARIVRMHWSSHPLKNRGLYKADVNGVDKKDDYSSMVNVFTIGQPKPKSVQFPDDYPFVKDGRLRSPWYDAECKRCASLQEIAQELDINFQGSEYQFFDAESIKLLKKEHCRLPLLVGDLEYDPSTLEPRRFYEHEHGKMSLWIDLRDGRPAKDRKFVIGSDVSAGTGASNSVSCVVDRETGEKVGVLRDPNLLPNSFALTAIALGKWFNKAYMVWDRSGPTGEVFTQVVVSHGYGNIYFRRNEKKIGRPVMDEPGYFLNPQAKVACLENYRDALSTSRYINRSVTGMDECLQFVRRQDGSVVHSAAAKNKDPSGARTAHGDEVVADALACLGMIERQEEKVPEGPAAPTGSLAWRRKRKELAEMAALVDTLGGGW